MVPSLKGTFYFNPQHRVKMLFHQLLAIIIYSGWHYGKIYHDVQEEHLNKNEAVSGILLVLLMSYLLFSNTTLFFAITFAKFLYDVFMIAISPIPALHIKNKENIFDAMIGMSCCVVYILG